MSLNVQRSTVKINNNEMDYFTFGSGKIPFVMLPGLSVKSILVSAEGVASAYRAFADDFTVYCFDRTKFLTKNYTIEMLSDDTAEAMRALGITNACVFGASMGGMMAQYIAIKHPELVGRLFLASTASRLNPLAQEVMGTWISYAEAGDIDSFCDYFIDVLYGRDFAAQFGEFIKLAHKDVTKEDFDRFVTLGTSCKSLNAYDRLDEIKCPTLVVGAENDRVLGAEASRETAEKLGCPIYMYGAEYGHCVFDEAPDYKDRIMNFFLK